MVSQSNYTIFVEASSFGFKTFFTALNPKMIKLCIRDLEVTHLVVVNFLTVSFFQLKSFTSNLTNLQL